jgi:N-methylhydantoinase B/oxoprolinase/acetone carboxylase alpha subunit
LEPAEVTLLSERRTVPPYGLEGGQAGSCGATWLREAGGKAEKMPGKFRRRVGKGARLRVETPGGGGFGSE